MNTPSHNNMLSALILLFLASIYPFISFFEHNISETYYFASIFSVWIVCFIPSIIVFLFATKLWPKCRPSSAAIILAIAIISLFSFHYVEKATADLGIYLGTIKILIWMCLSLIICILGYFIARSQKLFTVLIFILIGVNLAPLSTIAITLYYNHEIQSAQKSNETYTAADQTVSERPNVYWIILDMYARHDVLQDEYGYDNKPFLEDLGKRGFYIADQSYSNMRSTKTSLSTTLAMDYYLPVDTELNSMLWQHKLQGKNAVVDKFRSLGYNYIHVEPGGNNLKTRCGGGEDLCIHGPQIGAISLNEAHIGLMQLTPFHRIAKALNLDFFSFDFTTVETIQTHLNPQKYSPFFMFTHLLSPHPPARFDAQCNYLKDIDWGLLGHNTPDKDANYVQDIKCLNIRILTFLDWIKEKDPNAIIIVQSDHGSFLHIDRFEDVKEVVTKKEYWHTALAILNAYHLPQKCMDNLYPSISPVNNFPLVFACLEGKEFKPLPERHFIQHRKEKYEKYHEEIYEIEY